MKNTAKTLINMIMNEDLVQAQSNIKETLNERLNNALSDKFEEFAPTIFEGKGKKEKMADKDYDGDGKIESNKDEVWGSRLKAAKKAGRLKENYCEDGDCEDAEHDEEEMEESEEETEEETEEKEEGEKEEDEE